MKLDDRTVKTIRISFKTNSFMTVLRCSTIKECYFKHDNIAYKVMIICVHCGAVCKV